jgi:hypothetical protein
MTRVLEPLGYLDRGNEDLYRVTSDTFDAAVVVDWNEGRITDASPAIRYMVGSNIGELRGKAQERGWDLKLIPHVGYEDAYKWAMHLLRKSVIL